MFRFRYRLMVRGTQGNILMGRDVWSTYLMGNDADGLFRELDTLMTEGMVTDAVIVPEDKYRDFCDRHEVI